MNKKSNRVSIIMSVYNETDIMLKQAIESILNQTYTSFEFIIVLDNPFNQCAKELILNYKHIDDRIVICENKKNLGLANSLNKALSLSKNDLIARMDADDISFPDRIEKQVTYLNYNLDVDFISGQIEYIDEHGVTIKKGKRLIQSSKTANKILPYINLFSHPTWMFRKEILSNLIEYRNFPSAQDYDFILRAKYYGYKLDIMDEVILKYRIRHDSISVSKYVLQKKMTIYIQQLYSQRKTAGRDNFDINYIKMIESDRDFINYKESTDMYHNYKKLLIKGQYGKAIIFFLKSFMHSKDQCRAFLNSLRLKVIIKVNGK